MVGDAYTNMELVGAAAYLECKPAAGQEIVIHNVYHPNDVTLKMVDGSGNECDFYDEAGKSMVTNIYFHITTSQYLRIYNSTGGALYLAADGVVTKEP